MFDKTYVKNPDGSITVWEEDIFGNPRQCDGRRVPRRVMDAFNYYNCSRVTDDGFEAKPDMTARTTDPREAAVRTLADLVINSVFGK